MAVYIQDKIAKSRLTLYYKTEVDGTLAPVELPMRFMVLGDFSGRSHPLKPTTQADQPHRSSDEPDLDMRRVRNVNPENIMAGKEEDEGLFYKLMGKMGPGGIKIDFEVNEITGPSNRRYERARAAAGEARKARDEARKAFELASEELAKQQTAVEGAEAAVTLEQDNEAAAQEALTEAQEELAAAKTALDAVSGESVDSAEVQALATDAQTKEDAADTEEAALKPLQKAERAAKKKADKSKKDEDKQAWADALKAMNDQKLKAKEARSAADAAWKAVDKARATQESNEIELAARKAAATHAHDRATERVAARDEALKVQAGVRENAQTTHTELQANEALRIKDATDALTAAQAELFPKELELLKKLERMRQLGPPEAGTLPVTLNITSMASFEPREVCKQVPKLRALLLVRKLLVELQSGISSNKKLRNTLDELYKDKVQVAQVLSELKRFRGPKAYVLEDGSESELEFTSEALRLPWNDPTQN